MHWLLMNSMKFLYIFVLAASTNSGPLFPSVPTHFFILLSAHYRVSRSYGT